MTDLTTRDIQKLAERAGVNNPVMSVRVVGDRIELHLLGGAVVPVPPDPAAATVTATTGQDSTKIVAHTPPDPLDSLTVAQLKRAAAQLGLTGYSKLKRQQLIDTLNANFTDAEVAEVIRS